MEKVSVLSMQKRIDRQRKKTAETPGVQVKRLTHAIMNQLTVVYLSCAKLRRSLGPESSASEDSDIRIIESAVAKIAEHAEALRFRLEKAAPAQAKAPAKKSHKQVPSTSKLSFISPLEIPKT
jgi:nitrogen fixation/metabolism regulation signal transduction histidine kinase